ncbi:hypothetical protein B0H10DRAFT_2240040 [Mycena sp. CBHHK59/15]|nr:hypothetical protein B0H10DRAFT_2240040 [Mycena sp. CBHHK59/15]
MLKLSVFPGDITLNGKAVPKLEQADDLLVIACSAASFQDKLNDTGRQTGDMGCEIQELKCEFAVAGLKHQEFWQYGGASSCQMPPGEKLCPDAPPSLPFPSHPIPPTPTA